MVVDQKSAYVIYEWSLRASREVWPENEAFGAADADNEDEFMAMREILMADIPKPKGLSAPGAVEGKWF